MLKFAQAALGLTNLPQTRGIGSSGNISVSISIVPQSAALTKASFVTRSRRQPPMTVGQTRPDIPEDNHVSATHRS